MAMAVFISGTLAAGTTWWLMRRSARPQPDHHLSDALLNSSSDALLLLDAAGRVRALNPAMRRYLDSSANDAIGQSLSTLFRKGPPELRAALDQSATYRDRVINGRAVDISLTPYHDASGAHEGTILRLRDITGRKLTEVALRENERRYRALFENSNDAIFIISLEGTIMMANQQAADLLGYQLEDLLGMLASHHLYPEDQEARQERVRQLLAGEKVPLYERAFKRADGSRVPVEVNLLLVRDTDGTPMHLQMVVRDLTARKDLENALNHRLEELQKLYDRLSIAEQTKTDMIRIASHDLKNPLAVIEGYLDLLRLDEDQFSQEHLEFFEAMRKSTTRMANILGDILSLERIQQMAELGTARSFDLGALVQRALLEYQQQAADRQQELTLDIPPDDRLTVFGDEPQLYEAASNLISNALKYTPEGGTIRVELHREDHDDLKRVRYQVVDNGYGIPEDRQERLFQPFYRAKTKETEDIDGTGLGLHLVKNIVERHDGEMIFNSVYGQGSTFGFRLPLLEVPVAQAATQSDE